jgi:hypothetical protein
VERERGKGTGKIHSLLHPCTRAPECNSLCWLVEKRERKRKVALSEREKQELLRYSECPSFTV